MCREFLRYLSGVVVLGFFLVGLTASPLWGETRDPKRGAFWYHEAGCDGCHGKKGRGDGISGLALNPKPADFCTSTKAPTDAEKVKIIMEGGASVGRSSAMPAWGGALDKQAILDLVSYIHALCKK